MHIIKSIIILLLTAAGMMSFSHSTLCATPRTFLYRTDSLKMEQWVDSVMNTLTPDERLGQLIIPIVDAKGNTPAQRQTLLKAIETFHVGGLLFSAGTLIDQARFTNLAQQHARVPLFITLDGEWGLHMRLKDAPRFPRNMALGCIDNTVTDEGKPSLQDSLLRAYGLEIARECRLMNIQINFAPVLDINNNPNNPVIGSRAFGDTYEAVATPALHYAAGLEEGGVLAVGKHFPGHGDTDQDSHKTLPQLHHDSQRLRGFELQPFKRFSEAGLGGIMVAHLSIPAFEPAAHIPSSASPSIVTGLLREELQFDGLIFTDGLAMEGARRFPEIEIKALLAGVDILLDPTPLNRKWESLKNAITTGKLPQELIDRKCRKVLRYKYAAGLNTLQPIRTDSLRERINTPQARQLARELYAASLCVLKNDTDAADIATLPLIDLDKQSLSAFNIGASASNTFTRTLARYAPVEKNSFTATQTTGQQSSVLGKAAAANRCIIAIYDHKKTTVELAHRLCQAAKSNYILCFFTSPYKLMPFSDLFESASAIILAHEDCVLSNEVAAEAVFGGCTVSGRLGVTIPDLFSAGTGYHHTRIRPSEAEPEKVGMRSDVLNKIDSLVSDGIKQKAFPGCQVLIAKDGYIIYNRSFGHYDYSRKRPVTSESVYDLASVSKAAATVPALMLARDECHLRLNDRISAYLPKLKNTDKKTLTIREALYHETGMRDSYPFYQMAIDKTSITKLYSRYKDATFSIRQDRNLWFNHNYRYDSTWVSTSPDEQHSLQIARSLYLNPVFTDSIWQKIIDLPLQKRGTYRYSCLNFVLLRRLIEQVTRQPLDKYLQNRLFAPLGATTLCYNPHQRFGEAADTLVVPTENDAAIRKQILQGYVHDEIAAFSGGVEGNAGLFGSAQDLFKVLELLLNEGEYAGRRYISEETCRLFTGSKTPHSRRGLGFDKPDIKNPHNSPTARECPGTVYGHTGYTGTCFWVDPDNRMIYIFLCNRIYPHRWNTTLTQKGYRTQIQSLLYEAMR